MSLLGGSAEIGAAPERAERQLADATGRLSRALPLYFNEQLALRCGCLLYTSSIRPSRIPAMPPRLSSDNRLPSTR